MTSKDIQPFIIRKSYVTGTTERGRQRESDTKNRRCGNNHSAPPHIQPSAISNHFCCVILFAPKWGLNFHGLYHIVLCCTRLQREASGREQSEREGIYIYLVCGLMAPYVCEKKWQAEVGSERRPTTPPHSRCAAHLTLLQTHASNRPLLCECWAALSHWGCSVCLNALGWVSGTQLYTTVNITHTAATFIWLPDKRAAK